MVERERWLTEHWKRARPNVGLDWVGSHRTNADDDFGWQTFGTIEVLDLEHLGTTENTLCDGFHAIALG